MKDPGIVRAFSQHSIHVELSQQLEGDFAQPLAVDLEQICNPAIPVEEYRRVLGTFLFARPNADMFCRAC